MAKRNLFASGQSGTPEQRARWRKEAKAIRRQVMQLSMNQITLAQWGFLDNEDKNVMLQKWGVASNDFWGPLTIKKTTRKKTTSKKTTSKRNMSAGEKKAFVARMAKARAEKRK